MKKQQIYIKELEEGGSVWTHKKFIYDHNTETFWKQKAEKKKL